jgi:hypothetical protein
MRIAVLAAAITLLAGCETVERMKDAVTPDPAPVATKKAPAASDSAAARKAAVGAATETSHGGAARTSTAQSALEEGLQLYDKGEFNAAIRRLNAPEINSADTATQVKALKYKAFSYCVTSRQTLCRQQFQRAVKLDPSFDLAPGEKGHPMWGSVFERVKRAK